MPETLAELKAKAAAAWDSATRTPLVTRLVPPPPGTPEGFAAWSVGDHPPRSVVVLPALDPQAPFAVHQRYIARVIATATGHCPLCSRAASLNADPERTPAAWQAAPVTVGVVHDHGCPAEFDDADRHLFPIFRSGEPS